MAFRNAKAVITADDLAKALAAQTSAETTQSVTKPTEPSEEKEPTDAAKDAPQTTQQPELTDEQILAFEQRVKDEEAAKNPLISQAESIDKLLEEFQGNASFVSKITVRMMLSLSAWFMKSVYRHCQMSMIGYDVLEEMAIASTEVGLHKYHLTAAFNGSNKHFTAFAFAWFESLLSVATSTYESALRQLESTPEYLVNAGFQQLAIEDFYEVTIEQFKALPERRHDPDLLLAMFQSDEISNAIVMHMRFITSAYLRMHAAEYEPFLEAEMISIDEFCNMHVEAFGRESDQYQIIAISKALNVPIEVAYLDGSASETVTFHQFEPEEANNASIPPVRLIYRPGHYDILYRKQGTT
ncbi:hypothetical protein BZG36_01212 [Bifiguratus adelaidae]|uniref:ubiquitinyl hydrolase 1 n=1 Tax=Bifiguratus adelaidae TaxID=1938954 RepID=A0A261Y5V2_9FUNG|nr:hypothetical protein BZG36_01212 [Bifiguratus adelaidae]